MNKRRRKNTGTPKESPARILVIDPDASSSERLDEFLRLIKKSLNGQRYKVTVMISGRRALRKVEAERFDVVLVDLTSITAAKGVPQAKTARAASTREVQGIELIARLRERLHVPIIVACGNTRRELRSALRNGASYHLPIPYDAGSFMRVIGKALAWSRRKQEPLQAGNREVFEIELPSDIRLIDGIVSYLFGRAGAYGIIDPAKSNLDIAMHEAIVNAVRHGNRDQVAMRVTLRAEFSPQEVRLRIADQGPGFDPDSIPDPLDPENMLKTSGRGLSIMREVLDEVTFNESGNEITLIKRKLRRVMQKSSSRL